MGEGPKEALWGLEALGAGARMGEPRSTEEEEPQRKQSSLRPQARMHLEQQTPPTCAGSFT